MHSIWDLKAVRGSPVKISPNVYFAPFGVIQQKKQTWQLSQIVSHIIRESNKEHIFRMLELLAICQCFLQKNNFSQGLLGVC